MFKAQNDHLPLDYLNNPFTIPSASSLFTLKIICIL